jgi:ABC-2 type transport system permease protein
LRGTWTICCRELAGLFLTPLGWMLLVAALFTSGFLFIAQLADAQGNILYALEGALGGGPLFWMLMITLPPRLCMRLLAEESRTGTLEYLLTAPVSDAAVIVGKYLAATLFMALLWLSVPVYGLALHMLGTPPDWAALWVTYLGAALVSSLFVSIGLFASSLTQAPLWAAFRAFISCTLWLMLPWVVGMLMSQLRDTLTRFADDWATADAWIQNALESMDVFSHFGRSFLLGWLDTSELVFFVTWPAFFLFLTIRSLETRRWRI